MKRLWIVFLGVTMLASSWGAARAAVPKATTRASTDRITGCTAKGTVSFMFWGDKGEKREQDADVKLAEKACPGLHVNEIWDQGSYDTDLATRIGSGNAPDVFQLDAEKRLPEMVTEGALTNLDPYIKKYKVDLKKIDYPICYKESVYHGHVYGLTRDCGSQGVLFYNKDMFDARHVKYPTNKWTYKDFQQAAVKLTGNYATKTDPTTKLRFGYALNEDDYRLNQYLWDWGSNWLSSNLKTCTLDSKKSQAALQWWVNLAYKYHGAPTTSQSKTAGDYVGGFRDQNYAMTFAGPWALNYMVKPSPYTGVSTPKFRWGAVLPIAGPQARAALVDTALEVVYSHSKNKNAAFWLARFLTQGKGGAREGRLGIGIPGDRTLATNPAIKKEYGQLLPLFLKALKYGRGMRAVPSYDKFWDTVNTDLTPMWSNQQSVADATAKACKDVKPYLP